MVLYRGSDGTLYVAQDETYVYAILPSGAGLVEGNTDVYGTIHAVAGVGSTLYAGTGDTIYESLLAIPPDVGTAIAVGGSETPSMRCDLPGTSYHQTGRVAVNPGHNLPTGL
jgi:hypothetical protein